VSSIDKEARGLVQTARNRILQVGGTVEDVDDVVRSIGDIYERRVPFGEPNVERAWCIRKAGAGSNGAGGQKRQDGGDYLARHHS
jgi:hypothetical protein